MKETNHPNMRISLELGEEKRLSGRDLFALLDNIDTLGSISKAALEIGVSYRYSWGLLKDAERVMNTKLVHKTVGGHAGGGAQLTAEGKLFLQQYRKLKNEIDLHIEDIFQNDGGEAPPQDVVLPSSLEKSRHLFLASTMEPVETGLLDVLEQAFYQETGILVRHIAVGSGRALALAEQGRVDVVLCHAPQLEEQFMKDGFGKLRIPVMRNDYIVVGPKDARADDHSCVESSPSDAFRRIAQEQLPFISRNDMSGTHLKEQELWKDAGISPEGQWYSRSSGLMGNLGVLRLAMEKDAYTIVDYATFLLADAREKMSIICGGGKSGDNHHSLANVFSLILVNPDLMQGVNFKEASVFADWMKRESTKTIIASFGVHSYGEPLFTP